MRYKEHYNRAKLVLFACLFSVCISFAFGSTFELPKLIKPEVVLPSASGLGGVYSAYKQDFCVLFSNPALYPFISRKTTITAINFRADSLAYSALKYVKSSDRESQLLSLLGRTNSLCTNAAITGPISFAFLDKTFGFGIFNTTRTIAQLPSLSHFSALLGEDIVITGGYGGIVYEKGEHTISLGVNMKGFLQTYAYIEGTVFGSSYTLYEKKFEGLPIVLQAGFGIDAGFAYKYQDKLTLSATLKDMYTPVFTSYYENYKDFFASKQREKGKYKTFLPVLSFGLGVEAFQKGYFRNVYSLSFYFDWRDVFSFVKPFARNYFLNFAFGGELVFHRVLSVRFGIMDLYPQLGIGLDFTYFTIDFSAYGKELSLTPWQRPIINIEIGIRFDI